MRTCLYPGCGDAVWRTQSRAGKCLAHRELCIIPGCDRTCKSGRGYLLHCRIHGYRVKNGLPIDLAKREQVKGGKWSEDENGYLIRWEYNGDGTRKKVRQHRAVMEEKLGRELLPGENVHHKNGDRTDNRPENLELWITMQPSGQRPEDLVEWAREILARYEYEVATGVL